MFKRRLRNTYAYNNKTLKERNQGYSPIYIKTDPDRAEFRIPSAVKNAPQLKRRFKLFAHLVTHIYSYATERDAYNERMEICLSRQKRDWGVNTLFRDFAYDLCFTHEFYNTDTYRRTKFLLHDIGNILQLSYQDRIEILKIVIINAYQFQAWLDDSCEVNLTSILKYIEDRHISINCLSKELRRCLPCFTPDEGRNGFNDDPDAAINDDYRLLTENQNI